MPIRTRSHNNNHHNHSHSHDNNEGSQLHNQINTNRLSLFSSFGKEAAEAAEASTIDTNEMSNSSSSGERRRFGRRPIQPMDQRRSPYYYNDVLVNNNRDHQNAPDELIPPPEPITISAVIENDASNSKNDVDDSNDCSKNQESPIELDDDEHDDVELLHRNTMFNANLMGGSTGSLDI